MGCSVCNSSTRASDFLKMKVLVTGATGFIGKSCIDILIKNGIEVHLISRRNFTPPKNIKVHQLDLLNTKEISKLMKEVKPTHLLHLAWEATPGKFWTSPKNLDWVIATLELIKAFTNEGGVRLVAAGTCAEYDWSNGICRENHTELKPNTLYGVFKNTTHQMIEAWCKEAKISYAWGRVFSVYGPHEDPKRLTSSLIMNLLKNQEASCSSGNLIRDYLHTYDIANAFVHLLSSEYVGPINISSGDGIPLGKLAIEIAEQLGKKDLLSVKELLPSLQNPLKIIGDNTELVRIGWHQKYSIEEGLAETISWWKENLHKNIEE